MLEDIPERDDIEGTPLEARLLESARHECRGRATSSATFDHPSRWVEACSLPARLLCQADEGPACTPEIEEARWRGTKGGHERKMLQRPQPTILVLELVHAIRVRRIHLG